MQAYRASAQEQPSQASPNHDLSLAYLPLDNWQALADMARQRGSVEWIFYVPWLPTPTHLQHFTQQANVHRSWLQSNVDEYRKLHPELPSNTTFPFLFPPQAPQIFVYEIPTQLENNPTRSGVENILPGADLQNEDLFDNPDVIELGDPTTLITKPVRVNRNQTLPLWAQSPPALGVPLVMSDFFPVLAPFVQAILHSQGTYVHTKRMEPKCIVSCISIHGHGTHTSTRVII